MLLGVRDCAAGKDFEREKNSTNSILIKKKNYTNLISLPIASNLVFTSLALHKHEWKKTGFPNHLIKNWDYDKDTSPSTLDGIFIPSSFLWAIHCCEIFFLHFLVFPELHTNQ